MNEFDITDHIEDWYRSMYPDVEREHWVVGNRYADLYIPETNVAVEVESDPGKYREGVGQALHYQRAGYTPVVALPIDKTKITDPNSDEGEALNVLAEANVGLVGVQLYDWEIGYILRPFR